MLPRMKLQHPNLAEFKNLEELAVTDSSFCTRPDRQYRLEYELLTYNMFHEIQRYCKLKQPFPED